MAAERVVQTYTDWFVSDLGVFDTMARGKRHYLQFTVSVMRYPNDCLQYKIQLV